MSTTSVIVREAARLLSTHAFVRFAERLAPGEGEDLRQDVALALLDYERRGGEPPRNLAAFLSICLRNEALTRLQAKRAQRRTAVHDPAMAAEMPSMLPLGGCAYPDAASQQHAAWRGGAERIAVSSVCADVEEAIDLAAAKQRLCAAIDRLAPPRREAIVRTFFEGVPTRQQGIPFGTVVVRISRAKAELAASMR